MLEVSNVKDVQEVMNALGLADLHKEVRLGSNGSHKSLF